MKKRIAAAALLPPTVLILAAQSVKPRVADAKPVPPPHAPAQSPAKMPAPTRAFLAAHCNVCHDHDSKSGGLDLTSLGFDLQNPKTFAEWVKINDRVHSGEMPPPSSEKLNAATRAAFANALATPLLAADAARVRRDGRAVWRRMNRYEYENTLRDLLDAPWLQVKDMLPEDGSAYRFNKVGTALDVSHVQINSYLAAADYALREAMAPRATRPETKIKRYYAREEGSFTGVAEANTSGGVGERNTFLLVGDKADLPAWHRKAPITVGDKDPALRDQEGVGMISSSYEPLEPTFGRFRAPVSGHYRIRLNANSFWSGPFSAKNWWRASSTDISKGRTLEPVTLYSQSYPRNLRKLGSFDVGPEATTKELDVYLLKGETIRPDAVRFIRSRPGGDWRNATATKDGQPGVDFRYLEVVGPIYNSWPTAGQSLLFDNLPITAGDKGKVIVTSQNPDADAQRLIRRFVARAYRRPVRDADVQSFVGLYHTASTAGLDFTDAMLTTYSAVLCSPEFVTFEEAPGPLDDYALATRLSYFLVNSEPDATLRDLAARGQLRKPGVLHAQVDRLLADPRSERFVDAFLDYWLDLRKVNNNSPDERLYPDYYLDDFLTESSLDETRAFFGKLIHDDLPAKNVVDSNFVMVNERLATLYQLPPVEGTQMRPVPVPPDSPRGGLLTQASVLKVTSNGTTTSPVIRGAWITERILGQPVPPPPPTVPAIEPDTRGATTIREQLDKHRTQPTCKACHANIDPPGFALESFDVFGGWRDHYRSLGAGERVPGRGKNGLSFNFCLGKPVDATGTMPDGRHFQQIRDFKKLLLSDQRQIARNLVRQFLIYGTGAPVGFGDRPAVEAILDRAKPSDYGVKSLLHAVIESPTFEEK